MPSQNKYGVDILNKPYLNVVVRYMDVNYQGYESKFVVGTRSNTSNLFFDFTHIETYEVV